MLMIDGPGDTFEFLLSDGNNTHYYDIFALSLEDAIELASRWFKRTYGTVHTTSEVGCTGLPLSKNY